MFKTVRQAISAFGGRKFLVTVGCGGVCSILLWFGKLDNGSYTAIILGTVGAFIAGAAYQNVKGSKNAQDAD